MPAPILAIKLFIPSPRPKVVRRPRLIERLNDGLHRRLTLISAPAGFGKTSLAAEWLAALDGLEPKVRAAWLSLDKADNDPTRFLTYLVAALQTLAPKVGAGLLAVLQAPQPQPPPAESILTALLNELASLPDPFVLVLDDYHLIDARPAESAVAFLLEHLPPKMHLVIATREDPDLPLARLRAQDQLTELRVADLRFTPPEAADFLNRAMGLRLSADDVAALERRTEGWIAGLQLAAISMQDQPDAASFIQSFTGSHHFVMDYLVAEVLQHQPDSIQTFLLNTSILDRLCGPLCEAVLAQPPSLTEDSDASTFAPQPPGQAILEHLERANLLVVPLDDRRQWYRYHHLFADVLQARLMTAQPDQAARLHQRACAWWEQNNFRAEAIRHALAARDFERAADLIERERLEKGGTYFRSDTWLGWVKALPDEIVRARPRLSAGFAWELLFMGELEAADARLRNAERWLEQAAPQAASEDDHRPLLTSLAIARAFHAQSLGDPAATEDHARRALALVPESDPQPRGLASALLGLARMTHGDLETAHSHLADGMASLRLAGNLLYGTVGTFVLAGIRVAQGRLLDAIFTYEQALQRVLAQGEPVLQGTADLYLGLSELYREQGHVEAARQHLLRSEALGKPAALDEWPRRLYLVQARWKEDQGDPEAALALIEQAERLHYRNPVPDARPVAALKARVWIRQGRLTEALAWAQRRGLSAQDDLSYLREFEHLTLARLLIAREQSGQAEGAIQEALGLLERLLAAAEEGGRLGSAIEILIQQALAHHAQGSLSQARAPLERALALAEPEGYVRVFVDEGLPMAELLASLQASPAGNTPPMSSYLRRLLAAFDKPQGTPPGGAMRPAKAPSNRQPLIEPLSQRELEILRLIARGLSNHEISQRLHLALSTVKGHNRNIFGKLQVQRRTEAVARARELGLV